MKSHLLIFAVLVTVGRACEARESVTEAVASFARRTLVAAMQSDKASPTKQPTPAKPDAPAPKPAEKERARRPARPTYLFL